MEIFYQQLPFIIFSFIFGLIFGSFATMASYRIPRGEDLIYKKSRCPSCEHDLGFLDLFPVFSWVFSGGKCRHCKLKVSCRYPLTELVMGVLFVLIYMQSGLTLEALSLFGTVVCLVIMVVTDLEQRIIPDLIQIALVPLGILYLYSQNAEIHQYFTGPILGLTVAAALRQGFYLWKKREGLGMGDVKFFAVAGLFLGIDAFAPFMLYSGIIGVLFSIIWKMLGKGEEFPFGPALAISMLACLLFPQYTVNLFYSL